MVQIKLCQVNRLNVFFVFFAFFVWIGEAIFVLLRTVFSFKAPTGQLFSVRDLDILLNNVICCVDVELVTQLAQHRESFICRLLPLKLLDVVLQTHGYVDFDLVHRNRCI